MKRNAARRNVLPAKAPRKQPHKFTQVFDGRGRRVRGLWLRNEMFYAQVRTKDWVGQVPLHGAKTVPQALAERQALKSRIKSGLFQPPCIQKARVESKAEPQTHSLAQAIERYQSERDTLQNKDPKTAARENGGLIKWKARCGSALVATETFDGKFLKDFALWRKEEATGAGP